MKLEKPLAIPPIFGQSLYPDTDLPTVSILKYQGLKGVVLSHIMATDPNTDVRPLSALYAGDESGANVEDGEWEVSRPAEEIDFGEPNRKGPPKPVSATPVFQRTKLGFRVPR